MTCKRVQEKAFSLFWVIMLIMLIQAGGCDTIREKISAEKSDPVVATVDGISLRMAALKREILEVRGFSATLEVDGATRQEIVKALQRLIRKELILEEGKKRGVVVTGEEVDREIEEIMKDYPEGTFSKMLVKEGIDETVWRNKLKKTLLIKKASELIKDEAPGVIPKELKRYMRNNRIYLSRKVSIPKKWHLKEFVFLGKEDAERARELLSSSSGERDEEILEGEGIRTSIFDLGLMTKREIGSAYLKKVASLSESDISDVIRLPSSYALFRVIKIEEKHTLRREEARKNVIRKIYIQKREDHLLKWLQGRFNKAEIKINERALGMLEKRKEEKK